MAACAGANSNGAVIHYQAAKETCKTVDSSTMLLIDSGGKQNNNSNSSSSSSNNIRQL